MEFKISEHAKKEMERRRIPLSCLESVMQNPEQVVVEQEGKKVY